MVVLTEKARRDGETSVKGRRSSRKGKESIHGWKGGANTLSRPGIYWRGRYKAGRKELGGGELGQPLTPGPGRGSHEHSLGRESSQMAL